MAHAALGSLLRYLRRFHDRTAAETTDGELLRRYAGGDEVAFAALVHRHAAMVWGVCRRLLDNEQDAEDAFQAAFLVLLRKAESLRVPQSLAAFLHGVASRIAQKARATAQRRRCHEWRAETPRPSDPFAVVEQRELRALLDEELDRLPEKYRAPLVLCYLEGLSYTEAARQLGWRDGTVCGRLARARELLRQRLSRRGLTLSGAAVAAPLSEPAPAATVSTVSRMAELFTLGETITGSVSTPVATLAQGALHAMTVAKLKTMGVLVALFCILAGGAGLAAHRFWTPEKSSPERTVTLMPNANKAKQAQNEPMARTDRYGDPLPSGAVARLGTVRFRHPFWVSGLAFTPDGKTLASACRDGSVRLWDAATGKEKQCFRRLPNPIPNVGEVEFLGVALSPDGKTLIAVENHDSAHVWDLATGKELYLLKLKGGNGFGLALSPDGKTLAIGDGAGKVHLWDAKTGKPIRQIRAKGRPISALTFSPDSKTLACGDAAAIGSERAEDGVSTIRLWDAEASGQLRELKGHTGGVTALTFSHDGQMLVSASHDATLRFWEPATGKQVRKNQVPDDSVLIAMDQKKGINCGGVLSVAYSPDGRLLASGSYDRTVRLWDAGSGKELHALRGHGREVTSVVFSPDSKVLASGSFDHTIRLWDAKSGEQLQTRQGHDGSVNNLAVSPDGRIVAAACEDHTIRLWELATQRQLRILRGHTDFLYGIAFSPDGRTVATASADRTVRLWDTTTSREIRQLPHQGSVYSIAFTPVRNMLISGEQNGTLHFWDGATGKELHQIPEIHSGHFIQLSSNGKILATAGRNAVHLLDLKTGKELRRFGGNWPLFGLSPDGQILVLQRLRDKIRLWNTATGDELGVLADEDYLPGRAGVSPFVFSPDGRLLARVGKSDLELWEVLSGAIRRRFCGHQASYDPLAFSPDGKTLLSGSEDTTILIWDVARQHERRPGLLNEPELQGLWRDLVGGAENADRAIWQLAAAPEKAVPYLEKHVHPIAAVAPERLTGLVADLDSDQFAVRDKATRDLEELGELAEAALRKMLAAKPSLEARRRAEELLTKLRGPLPGGERLRAFRAVEVLEHAGTEPARRLLIQLASGAPEARLTREARAALQRLTSRKIPDR